ncbi:MAG: hypothetical protein ABIE47_01930 [Pseudomonadota bacterium]
MRKDKEEFAMDWDEEYDNGYYEMDNASHREESMPDTGTKGGLGPMGDLVRLRVLATPSARRAATWTPSMAEEETSERVSQMSHSACSRR